MLNRREVLAGFFAAGAASLVAVPALAASWVLLGKRTVNLIYDHDTIRVGAGAGLFNRVRLTVTGNSVFMDSMKVTFSNGDVYDVPIRFLFVPGSSSRIIDLPGALRHIRRVDFRYTKLIGGGTAVVTLEGRKV